MANEIRASTEAAYAVVEVNRAEANHARYTKQKVVPRVVNMTSEVAKKGDTVNIRFFPTPTVNNVGAGGTVTNQALTLTQVQLVIDKWKEITVDVEDKAEVQSDIDLLAGFSKTFGWALAQQIDSDLLALHADFTTTPINDGVDNLSDGDVLAAVVALDDAKEPDEDRTWVFAPSAKTALMALEKFSFADATGKAVGAQINGQFGELYGSPVVTTPLVATDEGVRKNLYFHKEAMAVAIQRNVNIERLARTKKSTPLSADALYGMKVVRPTAGVVLNSLAS
jgi:hypothetical protein